MTVEVYRNLHKSTADTPVYSVRDTRTRHVIDHAAVVWMRDAVFRVSEAGRQRVLREKRKNVHAVVRGQRMDDAPDLPAEHAWRRATYNPYTGPSFTDRETGQPVHTSSLVCIGDEGILYTPEENA